MAETIETEKGVRKRGQPPYFSHSHFNLNKGRLGDSGLGPKGFLEQSTTRPISSSTHCPSSGSQSGDPITQAMTTTMVIAPSKGGGRSESPTALIEASAILTRSNFLPHYPTSILPWAQCFFRQIIFKQKARRGEAPDPLVF